MIDIKLDNGKYHIKASEDMRDFRCLRYGQEWRDLIGDNMALALCNRIQRLEYLIISKFNKICPICHNKIITPGSRLDSHGLLWCQNCENKFDDIEHVE